MASSPVNGANSNMEDEGGGGVSEEFGPISEGITKTASEAAVTPASKRFFLTTTDFQADEQQALEIFVRHVSQQKLQEQQRERRPSLPIDSIELPTLSGVVMKRKQQLQRRFQQQQQQNLDSSKRLSPGGATQKGARPLSISSISSAASSGSSSSTNSSASSGIQSSLTRNSSLNYGLEYRKRAYLASIESLNNPSHNQSSASGESTTSAQTIEAAFKSLNLSPACQFKDAAARAAVLAAGAQSRGFGSPGSRINRSLHASLRYDKNTAYRIHMMANARVLSQKSSSTPNSDTNGSDDLEQSVNRAVTISRNNSSTSSETSHNHQSSSNNILGASRFVCQCRSTSPSIASSASAPQVDETINQETCSSSPSQLPSVTLSSSNKAATLDSGSCQRSIQHHPDCSYSRARPRRASTKLQPSPSSASSHSNTSSLFRDDGFEDDFVSTTSEHYHSHQHHRLSFQGNRSNQGGRDYRHSRRLGEDDDEYQSCEEDFSNSHTTASTTSNLDDCALSTTSSSIIIQHDQQVLDKISLANAKQQYRKSLLLEHQQQQHLLHAQHTSHNKIQSLLSSSPKICHLGSLSPNQSNNTSTTSNTSGTAPIKQTKCDDRTVNIIGHMQTRSPGYWDSNLSITQRVVTEIIETERTYVEDLDQIVTGYICYLRNILKQQKHHHHKQQHSRQSSGVLKQHATHDSTNVMVSQSTDYEDKSSMLVFDDDTTSATNEVEDYEVEDNDNEIAIKENMMQNVEQVRDKHENCTVDGAIMTSSHIKKLFSNLEDIYKFNKDLLFRLEECYLNPSSVAECFVENASGFEVYTHYCTMYPQVVSTLTELMNNQTSAQLLKERQNELNQSLPLGAYLLKPVQRILKYHILFQSLIKHTSGDDTVDEKDRQLIAEAFSVMTSIACHINAMKKRHEHAIRVQEVQGLLSGWEGPDLTALGELILEDTFKVYNRPKSARHLFLFDNVLLITKKKRDGSLCYKGHIACSNLMLIENIGGHPLVFNTVPFDNPKALCAFQAKNLDKKRDWCLQMKEVMIKSFEVEIPGHVRDILMSLTDSNTDTNGSKSSSDATHTLRAPNYLDKKRTKLEKKK